MTRKKARRVVLDIGHLLTGMGAYACVSDSQETEWWKYWRGKPTRVRLIAEVLE